MTYLSVVRWFCCNRICHLDCVLLARAGRSLQSWTGLRSDRNICRPATNPTRSELIMCWPCRTPIRSLPTSSKPSFTWFALGWSIRILWPNGYIGALYNIIIITGLYIKAAVSLRVHTPRNVFSRGTLLIARLSQVSPRRFMWLTGTRKPMYVLHCRLSPPR